MFASVRYQRSSSLRVLRRIVAALVVTLYIITGALHGVCDLDVTNPMGKIVVSLADKSAGHTEKNAVGHHCHGCFSVSVPTPVTAAVGTVPTHNVVVASLVLGRGRAPGIDLPPPKDLT